MAWRSKTNFVTGDKPTAPQFNAPGLDIQKPGGDIDMLGTANGGPYGIFGMSGYSAPGQPGCLVVQTIPIGVASGAYLFPGVLWDNNSTGNAYSIGGMHSTGTNPSRITATKAGKFQFGGVIAFAANAVGTRQVQVFKSNVTFVIQNGINAMTGGNPTFLQIPTMTLLLAINDYIEFRPFQDSGSTVNTVANLTAAWMVQLS